MFGEATHRSEYYFNPIDFNNEFTKMLEMIENEKIVIEEDYKESTKMRINEFLDMWVNSDTVSETVNTSV